VGQRKLFGGEANGELPSPLSRGPGHHYRSPLPYMCHPIPYPPSRPPPLLPTSPPSLIPPPRILLQRRGTSGPLGLWASPPPTPTAAQKMSHLWSGGLFRLRGTQVGGSSNAGRRSSWLTTPSRGSRSRVARGSPLGNPQKTLQTLSRPGKGHWFLSSYS